MELVPQRRLLLDNLDMQRERIIDQVLDGASGVSASKEKAQNQISSGISTTVGATVFNLTLMWGICLIYGTKDMTKNPAFQPAESLPFKRLKGLRDTGVTIDKETSYTAGIMLLSLIPFVLAQPVTAFNSFFGRRILIFITLIVSLMLFLSYFLYQVVEQYTKKQRDEIAEIEHIMARLLKHVQTQALEAEHLVKDDGSPNVKRIKEIFHQYDFEGNNAITKPALEELIGSVKFGEVEINRDDSVKKVLRDFDRDGNDMIDEHEFVHGMTKWLNEAISVTKCPDKKRAIDEYDKIKWSEVDKIVYEVEKDGEINYKLLTWVFNKSVLQVLLGIAILTLCSKPLVISIKDLSDAIGMPSFLIPFVMVPLALNARMAIAAIFPASQKSLKTASLTFSESIGSICLLGFNNNIDLLQVEN
ncbi:hypothetical protein RND71_020125 [Anisodus tanguticus]|uniref:EF-hand domain-containing protein n=1 Tax=Anisodus tanguticus TaxID=243964 RepID=A0AAE1S1T4_9SOLA|nr:hypothetical protein RND71_020125 [Anisodus tanguticus]